MIDLKISATKSSYFLQRAYDAWQLCVKDWLSGDVSKTSDNCFSFNAIDSYVMSVIALEAFVNERLATIYYGSKNDQRKLKLIDMLKELDLVNHTCPK